ncbi:MAG: oxidoreductase [Verrucomicrobiaceae bacterium]|nr:oxidoreductase [Verrucomicrobiaceae bacterium]
MKAAVLHQQNGTPQVEQFRDPQAVAGALEIQVSAGSIGPTDLMRAAGFFGPVNGPLVIGGEGAGRLADGSRVYFGHAIAPFGAFSERTIVAAEEVWPIPDGIDDAQAIALGISGTGALIPLEEARIQKGETVLVLGATGPLGQIALQLARAMGAGRVIAAARNITALDRLLQRDIADEVVQLGHGDDLAALKEAAGTGYNVVLDVIYGPPAEAAMKATAPGARMMSIGVQAGQTVTLSLRDLVFRSHVGVGTGQRPASERRAAYERLLGYARAGEVSVDITEFNLDQAAQAWAAQAASPHGKIIVNV